MDDADRQRKGDVRVWLVPAVVATILVIALAMDWFLFAPSSEPEPGTQPVTILPEEGR